MAGSRGFGFWSIITSDVFCCALDRKKFANKHKVSVSVATAFFATCSQAVQSHATHI